MSVEDWKEEQVSNSDFSVLLSITRHTGDDDVGMRSEKVFELEYSTKFY